MKDIYEQIAELIRIELLKRGFIVNVTCTSNSDKSLKIETTTFQTTPVLFKKLWINNSLGSWIKAVENKEKNITYIDFDTTLSVNYETFGGGFNSTVLFRISFFIILIKYMHYSFIPS